MESCKAGLENRINAKEAQETLKMPQKTCHNALELGNQARFWVGWVQSQVTKHQKCGFSQADLPLYWQQISVLYSRIVPASIYNIQLYVRREFLKHFDVNC